MKTLYALSIVLASILTCHAQQQMIIEGVGWKGFRVGATKAELIKELGKPDGESTDKWLQWRKTHNIHCLMDDKRGAFELRFDEGFAGKTTAGISIGTPLQKALSAYGEPTQQLDKGNAKKLEWSSKGILIWFANDKTIQIVVFSPYNINPEKKASVRSKLEAPALVNTEPQPKNKSDHLSGETKKRSEQDRKTYSDEELRENAYQVTNKQNNTAEVQTRLKQRIVKQGQAIREKDEKMIMNDNKTSLGAEIKLMAPVWVIGSYDKAGKANMMTAAWVGICCSKPPCVSVALRQATYTYGNIVERKAFTVNIPSKDYVEETDYFGLVSGRDVDKLSATGLTPVKGEKVDAPYLKEFPVAVECRLMNTLEVGSHTIFIGEIMDVKADKSVVGENDSLLPCGLFFNPTARDYYGIGERLGKAFSAGNVVLKKATSAKQGDQPCDIPAAAAKGDTNQAYVISTVPANGDMNVSAQKTTEIVVTYSKEMMNGCCSWCRASEGEYPKTTGKPMWPPDKRTCILPVKLEANKTYAIWLNIAERYINFKDKDGRPAIPYLLVFRTVE